MSSYDPRQHQRRLTAPQPVPPPQQYTFPAPGQSRPPQQGYWPQQPPPQQPKHRRSHGVLITVFAVLVIIAAGGAAWALGGHHMPGQAAAKPLSCHQQYLNWKNGPGATAFKNTLNADSNALNAAGNSEDIPAMIKALKKFGADAATVRQNYPEPACADPAGYFSQILTDMTAAGDNAGTATGLGAIMVAAAPLQNIKPLEAKLKAELVRTTQVK